MTDYKSLLTNVIGAFNAKLVPGTALIICWNDKEHLQTWGNGTGGAHTAGVRVATVPLKSMPELETKPQLDREKVTVVAVGISKEKDYGDCRILYHMTVIAK